MKTKIIIHGRTIEIDETLYKTLKKKYPLYDIDEMESDIAMCLEHEKGESFSSIIERHSDSELTKAAELSMKTHLEILL